MTKQDRRFRREARARQLAEVIVAEATARVWPEGQEDLTPRSLPDRGTERRFPSSPHPGAARTTTEEPDMTKPATAKPAATEAPAAAAFTQPLTSREVAEAIGTDPKTLRRFLRDPKSTYAAAGQGGRYSFVKKDLPGLKKRFTAWSNAEAKARAARAAAKEAKAEAKPAKAPKASGKATPPAAPTFTAEQRVDRLEAMLRARGTHISQHRD